MLDYFRLIVRRCSAGGMAHYNQVAWQRRCKDTSGPQVPIRRLPLWARFPDVTSAFEYRWFRAFCEPRERWGVLDLTCQQMSFWFVCLVLKTEGK